MPNSPEKERVGQVKMFKDTFQGGFLSILYSIGSKPLDIWSSEVRRNNNFDSRVDLGLPEDIVPEDMHFKIDSLPLPWQFVDHAPQSPFVFRCY